MLSESQLDISNVNIVSKLDLIDNIDINTFKQDFAVLKEDKCALGIIYTPFSLVKRILDLIPNEKFENPRYKWLDMGAGTGYFSICLFDRLNRGLSSIFPDFLERKAHIIENMLYMSEIKASHVVILKRIFGEKAMIFGDFLSIRENNSIKFDFFDFIIGNPPYNCGEIKTPTNTAISKKEGVSIWSRFIKYGFNELLRENGFICAIVPSIWMKPDKAGIYQLLTSHKILALHTLTNTETNKIFNYQAQTPTCYFLSKKSERIDENIRIFDKYSDSYVNYKVDMWTTSRPIPLHGISIINRLGIYVKKYGYLKVTKTSCPSSKCSFSLEKTKSNLYKNIKTCLLTKLQPILSVEWSNIPLVGNGTQKLVLAHKMYGFPFLDISGNFGISSRDNYIIKGRGLMEGSLEGSMGYSLDELRFLRAFLSTKFALFIYSTTAYRMKYLEKYAFELIPDICKIPFWREKIDKIHYSGIENGLDELIYDFFEVTTTEREIIEKMHKSYLLI